MIAARVEFGRTILRAYCDATASDSLADLLADLMHYAQAAGDEPFERSLMRAEEHYSAECGE